MDEDKHPALLPRGVYTTHDSANALPRGRPLRLAIVGTSRPNAVHLLREVFEQLRLTHIVILMRTGLGKIAHDLAVEMGIPVSRHWDQRGVRAGGRRTLGKWFPGGASLRHGLEEAVRHAVVVGKPDLVLCISPDWRVRKAARRHCVMLRLFRERGIRCIVGRFGNDRQVRWSKE